MASARMTPSQGIPVVADHVLQSWMAWWGYRGRLNHGLWMATTRSGGGLHAYIKARRAAVRVPWLPRRVYEVTGLSTQS